MFHNLSHSRSQAEQRLDARSQRVQLGAVGTRCSWLGRNSVTRSGSLLIEVMVSVTLVGLLLSVTVPLMKSANESRRLTDQRRTALQELGNLMEQVASWPRERVTLENVAKLSLSDETKAALPEAKLITKATTQSEPSGAVKIELSLDWDQLGKSDTRSVNLTSWMAGKP